MYKFLLLLLLSTSTILFGEDKICKKPISNKEELDIVKFSEAMGQVVGKSLQLTGLKLDMKSFLKGMENFASSTKGGGLDNAECIKVLSAYVEKNLQELAAQNLKKANDFLTQNVSSDGIVALEKGKVQYRVVKKGNGEEVKQYFSPLIRYTSKDLDGFIFNVVKEEVFPIDEAIKGLQKTIVGMKEGEKRVIYIHPDLGYGPRDVALPNLLLVFEVEVLKANALTNSNRDKLPFHGEISTQNAVR